MKRLLANLLDVRTVIGGLFTVYGVILTVTGLLDEAETEAKAQGVDINLWVGLGMLAVGIGFLGWTLAHPLEQVTEVKEDLD
ncbi:hypothetical protein [Actinocorallia longicatena]|uniref:Uncharacterized protein n=1 Tax=Actinocorallia longicatena TaxID=111803 RepID=A0ABP6QAY1_9ACTN